MADVGKKVLTLKYYLIRQVFLDNHTVVDMQCALKKLLGSRSSTNIWPGFLYCALLQFSRKILSRESVLVRNKCKTMIIAGSSSVVNGHGRNKFVTPRRVVALKKLYLQ